MKYIQSTKQKASQYTQDGGATIEAIEEELNRAVIHITLEHTKRQPKSGEQFQNNLESFLIKECDVKAKLTRETERLNSAITSIKNNRVYLLTKNGNILDRSIKELIRIEDAK